MRAEVIGPSGKIPVSVMVKERGKMNISFNPKVEGRTFFTINTQQDLLMHSSFNISRRSLRDVIIVENRVRGGSWLKIHRGVVHR